VDESAGEVEVLSGPAAGGLRWDVVCSGDDVDLYTLIRVYPEDKRVVAGSGALPDGHMPASIRAERDGTVLEEQPQRMPRPFLRQTGSA
jgi:hypothetical protein